MEREQGVCLTATELLANSLAKLAAGVQLLAGEAASQAAQAAQEASGSGNSDAAASPGLPAMMLFAGRRSSSRRYLLLQNWCVALRQFEGS